MVTTTDATDTADMVTATATDTETPTDADTETTAMPRELMAVIKRNKVRTTCLGRFIIRLQCVQNVYSMIPQSKARRQYLLTLQVSKYYILPTCELSRYCYLPKCSICFLYKYADTAFFQLVK